MIFERLVNDNQLEWDNYINHSFCNLIARGELELSKFRHYLSQDYEYLRVYNNCFKLMEVSASSKEQSKFFKTHSIEESELEPIHQYYNVDDSNITISQITANYTNYLYKMMMEGTYLERLVALAPCFIGYAYVGQNVLRLSQENNVRDNYYQRWIDIYSSPVYFASIKEFMAMINAYEVTEVEFNKLSEIFKTACKLESDFFKQATGETRNCVLTIAGSDSGGGAGIQADIKAISANGCYAASAITAITAQSTTGVYQVELLEPQIIAKQIEVVCNDLAIKAIKIGMLANSDVITSVAQSLSDEIQVVLDPVMVAKDMTKLLDEDSIDALVKQLFPKAYIITPNIEEVNAILKTEVKTVNEMRSAAKKLTDLGAKNVLIKGGHMQGDNLVDVLYWNNEYYEFATRRIDTENTHGTGCTLSSALAANLAKDYSLDIATERAITYVQNGIIENYPVGHGKGPVNHFHSKINL